LPEIYDNYTFVLIACHSKNPKFQPVFEPPWNLLLQTEFTFSIHFYFCFLYRLLPFTSKTAMYASLSSFGAYTRFSFHLSLFDFLF